MGFSLTTWHPAFSAAQVTIEEGDRAQAMRVTWAVTVDRARQMKCGGGAQAGVQALEFVERTSIRAPDSGSLSSSVQFGKSFFPLAHFLAIVRGETRDQRCHFLDGPVKFFETWWLH